MPTSNLVLDAMQNWSMDDLHAVLHLFAMMDHRTHASDEYLRRYIRKELATPLARPDITLSISEITVQDEWLCFEVVSSGNCEGLHLLGFDSPNNPPIIQEPVIGGCVVVKCPQTEKFCVVVCSTEVTVGKAMVLFFSCEDDDLKLVTPAQSVYDQATLALDKWLEEYHRLALVNLLSQLPESALEGPVQCMKLGKVPLNEQVLNIKTFPHVNARRALLTHPPNIEVMGWKQVYKWYCCQFGVIPAPEFLIQLPHDRTALSHLTLANCRFGKHGIRAVAEVLRHATDLRTLKFPTSLNLEEATWIADSYYATPRKTKADINNLLINSLFDDETCVLTSVENTTVDEWMEINALIDAPPKDDHKPPIHDVDAEPETCAEEFCSVDESDSNPPIAHNVDGELEICDVDAEGICNDELNSPTSKYHPVVVGDQTSAVEEDDAYTEEHAHAHEPVLVERSSCPEAPAFVDGDNLEIIAPVVLDAEMEEIEGEMTRFNKD
eukprot:TRINITY_DN60934_c0_g2_i1.p1 TRINITY_DN60934_c0_g2~~TRINITY_DN60934_c0_g2_i1.p1  ORF type:complete len:495 (-),score=41.72 TRINITY_DN60934_c0_g2_i1:152-1636(-)